MKTPACSSSTSYPKYSGYFGHPARLAKVRAFTFTELMIATAITGVTTLVICLVLNSGMILFAKNSSINVAHEQARTAVLQIEQDIHSAISLPELVDTGTNVVSGTGPAAGISFQVFGCGPFKVAADATASANQVKIYAPSVTATNPINSQASQMPTVGEQLIIPLQQIELGITAVSSTSNIVTLTLSGTLGQTISGTSSNNIACFATDRIYYIVQNGNLMFNGPTVRKNSSTMANNLTSATPFGIPNTPAGALYSRFVAAINLSTADPEYSNRSFRSANMFLNSQVPMRARLCTYQ